MQFGNQEDTICALSSPAGMGAIALVRMSGSQSLKVMAVLTKKDTTLFMPNKAIFSRIYKGVDVLDEVVITYFKSPSSFTGEDIIEIACHGSTYIQAEIIQLLLAEGVRLANPGEFSMRAFLNGKMDLSQTEAVADLIASDSKASHRIAMEQMRGGFSDEIKELRQELLNFASLIELELDFSQEDVEFADRTQLEALINKIDARIRKLIHSFQLGNVLKSGVPVAIIGPPNAGKSTLLNAILNEDKAIVSDVPGTTRDTIEDVMNINGVNFRFIDTAGIRQTNDVVENMGIQRSYDQIKKARIVLLLFDLSDKSEVKTIKERIDRFTNELIQENQILIPVFNKSDQISDQDITRYADLGIALSAKKNTNLDQLIQALLNTIKMDSTSDIIVSNARHFDVLNKSLAALMKVAAGMEIEIPGDLLAMDIREALDHLGEITGEVSNDELLGNIFANFCIGK